MNINNIFDKLVKEKLESMSGELIEFDGQNCLDLDDNSCGGWDGLSHRCECGNRRVSWVLSSCHTYVYGEAY